MIDFWAEVLAVILALWLFDWILDPITEATYLRIKPKRVKKKNGGQKKEEAQTKAAYQVLS